MIRDFFRKHDIRCEENVNLKKCNTYRLDVMCDYMVFPNSYEKVAKVVKYCKEKGIRFMFLGNGSNVIFKCNRFAGVIIRLSEFNDIYVEDNIVIAGGGCSLVTLAARTISEGLTGLEFAGAIPGEVGASIAMNAGAYNEDMAGVLSKVLIVNDKNHIVVWEADGIDFSYRDSFFKGSKDFFVVAAEFTLKKGDKDKMHEVVKRRIIKRSETQPLEFPSAGSVFRNPEGLHAGKLIEDLGLKGFSIGGAKISEKHANFIINAGGATGEDIVNLIEFVRGKVKEKYDIDLILEQVIIE